MSNPPQRIGRVRSVNPQRREVRILLDQPDKTFTSPPAWLYFGPLNVERPLRCKAESVKDLGDDWQAVLVAGVPRETVAGLRGKVVSVTEAPVKRDEDRLDADDVLGMCVKKDDGDTLGVVAGMLESPGQVVLRIARENAPALLVPLVEPVVTAVDFEARVLTLVNDLTPYAVEEE